MDPGLEENMRSVLLALCDWSPSWSYNTLGLDFGILFLEWPCTPVKGLRAFYVYKK